MAFSRLWPRHSRPIPVTPSRSMSSTSPRVPRAREMSSRSAAFPVIASTCWLAAPSSCQDLNSLAGSLGDGEVGTSTVAFTTDGSPLAAGQRLTIRLVNLNGVDLEIDFDNVRLQSVSGGWWPSPRGQKLPLDSSRLRMVLVCPRHGSLAPTGLSGRNFLEKSLASRVSSEMPRPVAAGSRQSVDFGSRSSLSVQSPMPRPVTMTQTPHANSRKSFRACSR